MSKTLRNSLLSAAAALAVAMGVPNIAKADLFQIGFLLDSSGSIGASNWTTIKTGLANTIAGFVGLPDTYQLSVMTFSNVTQTIINKQDITAGNLSALQALINGAPFLNSTTNFNAAFTDMTALMNPGVGDQVASYINFATDGVPNVGGGEAGGITARNAAIAAGIDNISIEAIGSGVNPTYLQNDICYPGPCTIAPVYNFPNQGFYIAVADADAYADAIQQKIRVITGVPEPASLAVLGTALLGFGVTRLRRRRDHA